MDNLKPSQIIVLVSGAVLLVASFLDVYKDGDNAWGDFGVYTWPAILGVIVAGGLAAVVFGNVNLPERILTFSVRQLFVVLAFGAALIQVGVVLSILLLSPPEGADGPSVAIGGWLGLLAAIGLVVGAVMELQDDSPSANRPSNTPPSAF